MANPAPDPAPDRGPVFISRSPPGQGPIRDLCRPRQPHRADSVTDTDGELIKIGTDDVLTGIDALMDWWSCSPTCSRHAADMQARVGRSGIGPRGSTGLWSAGLRAQWHPEAGGQGLPSDRGLRAAVAIIDATLVEREPYRRAAKPHQSGGGPRRSAPNDPDVHLQCRYSADTQAR